uniref:MBD domain-containing protein n=1 Tax=Strigamia maritima TaxID=126957 RepID=T1JMZ2_STRMM
MSEDGDDEFEDAASAVHPNVIQHEVNFPWRLIGGSSIFANWWREEHMRQVGESAQKRVDVYYYPEAGKRLRSKGEFEAYCVAKGLIYEARRFNFAPIERHPEFEYQEVDTKAGLQKKLVKKQIHFTMREPSSYKEAMNSPQAKEWTAAVVQYAINTSNYRIELTLCQSERVWAYSDASWANDPTTSLSFGGFIVYVGGAPIGWSCRKQASVACSTMEAEFFALVDCVREVYWLCNISETCLIFDYVSKPCIFADALSSIQFTTNDVENTRTKHIRVKFHWLRGMFTWINRVFDPY